MRFLQRRPSVLPGFGLALGYALLYLGLVVLIPLGGLVLRTLGMGWGRFWVAVSSPRVLASYRLSFETALLAASVNAVFGLIVAWVLVRYRFPGRRLLDALVDLPFALPAHQLSFGFGSGLIRPAPGTWGTLFAWLVFVVLDPWLGDAGWAIVIASTFVLGAAAASRTGRALGRPDHGAIVIDEIVAYWLVLWLLPGGVITQAVAFLGFRFFDILKPPPIRAVDRRFKNGVGVMLDDLLAAFYTLLVASVLVRVF